ncbi:MAG: hypothetical protein EH224_03740 [Calditrichaeota bacterium]|nr:MAG: hypothetical protein EH224_03740 [Calditrichota bacterium]
MKKYLIFLLGILFALFTGCSSSTDDDKKEPVNEFQVLVNYLEAGDTETLGWVNNLNGWIVNLADIDTNAFLYWISAARQILVPNLILKMPSIRQ